MVFRRNKKSRKRRGPLGWLLRTVLKTAAALVLVVAALVAFANVYTVVTTRDDVHTVVQLEGEQVDAVVVLGASVFADGTPSDILADRLEVAADLYKVGAARAVIVSGDNRDEHYNESDAMKAYCVDLGVPESDVYVDHAGYDTYASMYRARYVYGADSVIVVTQAYHLYRAVATAQALGMEAQGVAADKGAYDNQLSYSLREVAARTKDFVQTLLRIPPADADQPITL
ncbi:MAG: ElyC/SanA/YdcF family protein [Eggerthellaceae bacterium]|nr:ElyC/SanA/YdcF family protein [Eggerthellaceae bacterium]